MSKTTNKFSTEVRARAVRMVLDHEGDHPSRWATIVSVAEKIGCVPQTLLEWVKKTEVDSGKRAGVTTDMAEKMKALEREFRGYMTVHLTIPRLIDDPKRVLPLRLGWILFAGMIRPGFLSCAERSELRALARDGLGAARAARRANAIVLLNDGWSCEEVATALHNRR